MTSNYYSSVLKDKASPTEYDKLFVDYIVRLAKINPQSHSTLVDIGCGAGKQIKQFKKLGFNCHGLDRSESPCTTHVIDFSTFPLPFEDKSVDVFFSKSVFEHLYINQHVHLIDEMKRCLTDEGIIILTVPDFNTCSHIFYHAWSHVHPFTVTSIRRMLLINKLNPRHVSLLQQTPATWNNDFYARLLKLFSLIIRSLKIRTPPLVAPKTSIGKFIRWSNEMQIIAIATKR